MKNPFSVITVLTLVLMAGSTFAKDGGERKPAGESLCGELDSTMEGPNCKQGTVCPQFVRMQYYIAKSDGNKVNIETKKTAILTQFGKLKGDMVCASGSYSDSEFEVTSIKASN